MTDGIGAIAQQGVISTQLQQTQSSPPPAAPPQPEPEAPPPDSGRGANVDTSA